MNVTIKEVLTKIGLSEDTTVYGCLSVGYAAKEPNEKVITGKIIMR